MPDSSETKLTVWWIPNPPQEAFKHPVNSPAEARLILEALAQYDLYLGDSVIFCNVGGLTVGEDGDEWEDDDCNDIWDTDVSALQRREAETGGGR